MYRYNFCALQEQTSDVAQALIKHRDSNILRAAAPLALYQPSHNFFPRGNLWLKYKNVRFNGSISPRLLPTDRALLPICAS